MLSAAAQIFAIRILFFVYFVVSALNRMDIDMKIIDTFMVPRGGGIEQTKKKTAVYLLL